MATGDMIRAEMEELAQNAKISVFDLARLAAELHDQHYATFKDLIVTGPFSARRLAYFAKIGELIRQHDLDQTQVTELGWTKLAAITETDDPAEQQMLLARAATATAHQLQELRRAKNAQVPDRKRSVLLRFSPDQHEIYAAAVMAYGATKRGKQLNNQEAALIALLTKAASQRKIAAS